MAGGVRVTRPWSELRNRMSPEAQAEVKVRAAEILASMPQPCGSCIARGWYHDPAATPCLLPPSTASSVSPGEGRG